MIELSTRLQLEFKTHSLLVLLQFFQGTIKSALKAAVLEEEVGIHFCKAKHEALAALAYVPDQSLKTFLGSFDQLHFNQILKSWAVLF